MMYSPVERDVVLAGCGHAHVAVLRRFGMRPIPGVRLTLVTPELDVAYSGMLPGVIEGVYHPDEASIDAGRLARFAGARLYPTHATGLDPERRLLHCKGRPPVPYDLLSLDIGATPATGGVPGAAEHAVPVKPIGRLLPRLEAALARLGAGGRLAVVGAGAGGVELCFALERRLRAGGARLLLVSGSGGLLPGFPERLRARVRALLAGRGVAVVEAPVVSVAPGWLTLADGRREAADEVLWNTAAGPAAWLQGSGLALDAAGFLAVDACLRVGGRPDVFAAGDATAFGPRPIPRSGVHAVRAGPVLAHNLRAALTGGRARPYRPQREALYLLSTGDRHALGTRNGVVVEGDWVWRWKDRVDRRFVARFTALPAMRAAPAPRSQLAPLRGQAPVAGAGGQTTTVDGVPPMALNGVRPMAVHGVPPMAVDGVPPSPGGRAQPLAASGVQEAGAMRCGGCGAKVGAGVLSRALAGLRPYPRPEVLLGLGAPDDAALVDTGAERLAVHSVDQFRAMIDDPYRFGRITANHALGDLFAMGAEPHTALALATLPYGPAAKMEAELAALMQGANEVLAEAGCTLVGGHSAEGAELALGLAVNGLVARGAALRKDGLRPGDALVLTRPIGTGTLLAAAMLGRARGRWVEAAIQGMLRSSRDAARLLREHGAHAATDVTGFGLLGHLLEMAGASGVGCVLHAGAVPLLEGAAETAAAGLLSSLAGQNALPPGPLRDRERVAALPIFPLLCDPQTAGGLLAGVPEAAAAACVAALRAGGDVRAAVVGRVEGPVEVGAWVEVR